MSAKTLARPSGRVDGGSGSWVGVAVGVSVGVSVGVGEGEGVGVRLGEQVLDVAAVAEADGRVPDLAAAFGAPSLNRLLSLGRPAWRRAVRRFVPRDRQVLPCSRHRLPIQDRSPPGEASAGPRPEPGTRPSGVSR